MDEPKSSNSASLPLHTSAPGGDGTRRKGIIRRMLPAFACPPFCSASRGTVPPEPPADESADQKAVVVGPPESYDTLGSELAENARIWHYFRTNVTVYDQTVTINEWNETLDVLLVFAALFLGAVTSFVIQAYPALSSDDSEAPSLLLTVAIGLFFCSLVVSLAVSLICILAKQWLQEYIRRLTEPTKNARYWAQRRWIYELGLKEWEIAFLCTDGLPLMLHLALFLFAVGLVMLLSTLQRAIAWAVGAITCLLAFFYVCSTLAPFVSVNAPTATPLLRRRFAGATRPESRCAKILALTPRVLFDRFTTRWDVREERYLTKRAQDVELSTMEWLLTVSREEASIEVAFSAVSALPPESAALEFVRLSGIGIADAFQNMHGDKLRGIDIMRVIRSELHVRPGDWDRPRLGLDIPPEMLKRLSEVESADAQLLYAVMQHAPDFESIAKNASSWRKMDSHSLPQTMKLLLRSQNIDAKTVFYLMLPSKAKDLCAMRGDFVMLASAEELRSRKGLLSLRPRTSSSPAADDGSVEQPSGQMSSADPRASALVSLAEVTTRFACTWSELAEAAQLAARISAPIKDQLATLISEVSWERRLGNIQSRARVIFSHLRSRDPVLGWCRTQSRLLHAIISEWCL